MNVEDFEKGLFDVDLLDNVIDEVLVQYADAGIGVNDIPTVVEKACRRSTFHKTKSKRIAKQFTLSSEEKRDIKSKYKDIKEEVKSTKPSLQYTLWSIFKNSPEYEKYRFFINEFGSNVVYYLTGKQEKNCYEVVNLGFAHKLLPYIFTSLCNINPEQACTNNANRLVEYINNNQNLYVREDVSYISEPTEYEHYTHRLIKQIDPKPTCDSPAWNNWLERISDPKAYAAWIWSIYETKDKGRQALYIQGPSGLDGKSITCEVVQERFGVQFCASISKMSSFSSNDRFGLSECNGKRLIVVPDMTNDRLTKYPLFKQITGGDRIQIEVKNKTPFSTRIDARIMICSNYALNMGPADNERSRILWLKVRQMEGIIPNWREDLTSQYDEFLRYAKHCYGEMCPDYYQIQSTNSTAASEIAIGAESEEILFEMEDLFEFDIDKKDEWAIVRKAFFNTLKEKRVPSLKVKDIKNAFYDAGFEDFGEPRGYLCKEDNKCYYRGVRRRGNLTDLLPAARSVTLNIRAVK